MKKYKYTLVVLFGIIINSMAQEIIPLDTSHWKIKGSYIFENYKGKRAIYNQGGSITLKDTKFLNGTIEFDLFLKNTQMFPGVFFRVIDDKNGEQFYLRPHLSGKPDANQVVPVTNGLIP